MVIKKMQY